MSIIGYTPGGNPIFFGPFNKPRKTTKSDKNTRFSCQNTDCNHKTTKNQAAKNGDVCFSCKSQLKR